MTLATTLTALDARLDALPSPGAARKMEVIRLGQELRFSHGADAVAEAGCAARVTLHGIKAHGIGIDGAARAWIIAARRQLGEAS